MKKYFSKLYYKYLSKDYSIFKDIKKRIPNFEMINFFDVGANEGNISIEVLENYPNCNIYSFEPNINTYNKLKTLNNNKISTYNLAFGNEIKQVYITNYESSTLNHIKTNLERNSTCQEVNMTTLEKFCFEKSITKISYLKIDTEGHDLEVLKGAISKLFSKDIAFIEVECGMNLSNDKHIYFQEFIIFFYNYDYNIFHIYEQVSEKSHNPISSFYYLRRSNIVFVLNDINTFLKK